MCPFEGDDRVDPNTLHRRDGTVGNPSLALPRMAGTALGCHPEGDTGTRAGGHLGAATSTSASLYPPCALRSCSSRWAPRAARVVGRIELLCVTFAARPTCRLGWAPQLQMAPGKELSPL